MSATEEQNDNNIRELSPTERALETLEILARKNNFAVSEVMTELDLPKTSAHRLVNNLETFGYLESGLESGKYQAGPKLLELALGVLASSVYQSPIHTLLVELARKTDETCSLGVIKGSEIIYVDSAISKSPLTLYFERGHKAPLHCTSSGRIFLADMPDRLLNAYLMSGPWEQVTPNTIIDPDHLRREVQKTRDMGYAVNDSEFVLGVVGVAVPVYDLNARVIACLSVSAPHVRKSLADMVNAVTLLQATSDKITRILFN
ncbi:MULTISPECIES: IclR family transcriptional regulator [Klebsiella pneumoniae complex]|uniref:IclR family transcriptional regulator n=1 Tax=Klebsiella pneumoniae complex TaxID=3390273 RepID=UPI00272FF744|nr:IclR family transcriptional regulator [Klebsiella pneumoniae]MDP0789981.1 IclR family transcriptional regulator [Klebsiella pneumoniae]